MQPEIKAYFKDVADQYDIGKHVRLKTVVESAHWDSILGIWTVTIRDLRDLSITTRRCKILVSAVGALSTPKQCSISGASTFKGAMFHTAKWDHSFDWANKEIVVVGMPAKCLQEINVLF